MDQRLCYEQHVPGLQCIVGGNYGFQLKELTQNGDEGYEGVPGKAERADKKRADAEQTQCVHGKAP